MTACWQITNIFLLVTSFISIIGLLVRLRHVFSVGLKAYDIAFILFYLSSISAIFLQWSMYNVLIMFPDSSTIYPTVALLFKGAIWFLALAATFLIYIGRHNLTIRRSLAQKYYSHVGVVLYLLSILILVLILFTDVTTSEIIDNSPTFDFSPIITFPLTGIYGLSIGIMFAIISIRSTLSLSKPMKELIPFYRIYIGFPIVGGGFLIIMGLFIGLGPNTQPLIPCVRMLLTSLIYIAFLWFPTLDSLSEMFFQNRLSRLEAQIERDKVLDIIDHDLANVTQILDTYFETIDLPSKDMLFLAKQIERMSKLITESRAIVSYEDDEFIRELIAWFKNTSMNSKALDLEREEY